MRTEPSLLAAGPGQQTHTQKLCLQVLLHTAACPVRRVAVTCEQSAIREPFSPHAHTLTGAFFFPPVHQPPPIVFFFYLRKGNQLSAKRLSVKTASSTALSSVSAPCLVPYTLCQKATALQRRLTAAFFLLAVPRAYPFQITRFERAAASEAFQDSRTQQTVYWRCIDFAVWAAAGYQASLCKVYVSP